MKSKSTILYLVAIILLTVLVIVSGYYAKGDWLKGQLGQNFTVHSSSGNTQNGSGSGANMR